MMRWTLDRSEDVYHSNTREPLGKSWHRGHTIPAHLGTEVAFGQRINAKENSAISLARSAIAPVDLDYEVRSRNMSIYHQAESWGQSTHQSSVCIGHFRSFFVFDAFWLGCLVVAEVRGGRMYMKAISSGCNGTNQ